ncbi:hypothetical protein ACHAWF_008464 [Thalassiosira exigua]
MFASVLFFEWESGKIFQNFKLRAVANKLLKERLAPTGYFEVKHTHGLWKHVTRHIAFLLVVENFGVKYAGREHAENLVAAIKNHYPLSEDWTGGLYCGTDVNWNYDEGWMDYGMPKYVRKCLDKFVHPDPPKPQHSPFPVAPRRYGKETQTPLPPDESPKVVQDQINCIQQVVGTFQYYARACNMTMLPGLSMLASDQTRATEQTMANMKWMLDYITTHPDARVHIYASDMILNIRSDASYMSERGARS